MAGQLFWVLSFSRLDWHLVLLVSIHLAWFHVRSTTWCFRQTLWIVLYLAPLRMIPHVLPFLLRFSKILLSFWGFVLQSQLHHLPVWKRIGLHLQHLSVCISMGIVCTSFRILRRFFSVTFISKWQRKSAAVLTEPGISDILTLNCSTKSHAFYKDDGGLAFVWKKLVTDLLSVKTIVDFDASHKMFPNSRNAMQIARNSFERIDIFICAREKIFDPNATGT